MLCSIREKLITFDIFRFISSFAVTKDEKNNEQHVDKTFNRYQNNDWFLEHQHFEYRKINVEGIQVSFTHAWSGGRRRQNNVALMPLCKKKSTAWTIEFVNALDHKFHATARLPGTVFQSSKMYCTSNPSTFIFSKCNFISKNGSSKRFRNTLSHF